ncbi:MAG: hypothetical protein R2729_01445 [Bryobacteraceae bacterium]
MELDNIQQELIRAIAAAPTGGRPTLLSNHSAGPEKSSDTSQSVRPAAPASTPMLSPLADALADLRAATIQQSIAIQQSTDAIADSRGPSLLSAASTAGDVAATAGQGLAGTIPRLIATLRRLFGEDESPATPSLSPFALPPSINLEAGLPSSGTPELLPVAADYTGLPRRLPQAGPASPAITINVSAMDSRSFVDSSEEIARAVRHALLNSHALRTVVEDI